MKSSDSLKENEKKNITIIDFNNYYYYHHYHRQMTIINKEHCSKLFQFIPISK